MRTLLIVVGDDGAMKGTKDNYGTIQQIFSGKII